MAEYSYSPVQTVAADENVVFNNGARACRKGLIGHRDDSGIFTLKAPSASCRALYAVTFSGNIAITTGGTVEEISVALTYNGEVLRNTLAAVTPAAVGDFFNVSMTTYIDVPCGCCASIAVENTSETTGIDVRNANIVFERIA